MRNALIILILGALVVGCTTSRSAHHGDDGVYRVEAFMAEVDDMLFHQLDLWEVKQNGPVSSILGFPSEDIVSVILSSKQYELDMFPVINIDPGAKRLIDMQHPITYPTAFNDDGSVKEENTRGVGRLIEVSIHSDENGGLILSYRIENTALVSWISETVGTDSRIVERPLFSSRAVASNMALEALGQWCVVGGLFRKRGDGTQGHLLVGIRVMENN